MEFDLSRVYTAANANKLKKGDNVFFSNTMGDLKYVVEESDNYYRGNINNINNEDAEYRFQIEGKTAYSLAYLVKSTKKKKLRPYRDIYEFTEAYIRKTSILRVANTIPMIWLKDNKSNIIRCITSLNYNNGSVTTDGGVYFLDDLFNDFTFLDGTLCGVEECI